MKIALAMICKGTDEEAKLLDRCLANIKSFGQIDAFYITRTHKAEEVPNEAVAKVVQKYKGVLSDFEWIGDFAAARNFNFSQVPKEYDYIMWTDADDMWRGLGKLKATIVEHPHTDAFGFWYLYDWDEFKLPTVVHKKTMVIKNDGCATWKGKLHEDLSENRQMDTDMIEGIERLHLSSLERHAENAKRNLEIAATDVEENPDDPRTLWNLANSQFAVSDFDGAMATFDKFIKDTHSDEEKYLAYQRVADVYNSLQRRDDAVKSLMYAIGLRAELPDAYHQLAYLYFEYENWDKAEYYALQGLVRRPKIHELIVYNPRDYDFNPVMLLAKVYFHKNRPDLMLPLLQQCLKIYPDDEKLKKLVSEGQEQKDALGKALEVMQKLMVIKDLDELRDKIDALPEDIRSHPMVCNLRNQKLVKTESSGRDLVIYCGHTEHAWEPNMFKTKGIGGSEEAVIHLAREWAKLGWNVTVYNNCGHKAVYEPSGLGAGHPGVTYKPFWEFNYRDKQDVVILWRWVKALDADINAPKIFIDLHDVLPYGEFNEKRLEKVTKIFVKTKFHRSLFPNVPDEKIEVIPNGMETYLDSTIDKDPLLVINTSSPDRSMDVLPALWKRVTEQVPGARMQWAYGWDIYKQSHADDPKKILWMEDTIAAMNDADIEILGRLPQSEVGKLYQKASFFAYPTEFAEIDCISVKKAQAAKCLPVVTDFGALDESVAFGIKVHSPKGAFDWNRPYQFHFGLEDKEAQDTWVEQMVKALNGSFQDSMWKGLDKWRDGFKWEVIAKRWDEIFNV